MQAIKFPGHNLVLAENQPQYKQLPVCFQGGVEKAMTSCYKLTLRERLRLLFKGKLYITQLTFGAPLQPQLPSVEWKEPICVNCNKLIGTHKSPNFFCMPNLN